MVPVLASIRLTIFLSRMNSWRCWIWWTWSKPAAVSFCQSSLMVARWSPALGDAQMMSKRLLLHFTSRMNWTGTRTLARQSWLFCLEKDQLDLQVEHVWLTSRGRSGDCWRKPPPQPTTSSTTTSFTEVPILATFQPTTKTLSQVIIKKIISLVFVCVCFPQTFWGSNLCKQPLIHLPLPCRHDLDLQLWRCHPLRLVHLKNIPTQSTNFGLPGVSFRVFLCM